MASIIKTDTEHTICAQCACYLNTGDLSFIDYHWNGEDAADMEERIVEFELTLLTPVDGATHCTLDTRGRTDHYGEFDCECCGCGEWGQPVVPIVHHWAPAADAVSL